MQIAGRCSALHSPAFPSLHPSVFQKGQPSCGDAQEAPEDSGVSTVCGPLSSFLGVTSTALGLRGDRLCVRGHMLGSQVPPSGIYLNLTMSLPLVGEPRAGKRGW